MQGAADRMSEVDFDKCKKKLVLSKAELKNRRKAYLNVQLPSGEWVVFEGMVEG